MATAAVTKSTTQTVEVVSLRRKVTMGIVFLALAALILLVFLRDTGSDLTTSFGMTPGGITQGAVGSWVVKSQLTLIITGGLSLLAAIYQLVRGFGKKTNAVLGVVALLFVFAFLTYTARGKSLNLGGMLNSALSLAVPIILAAYSGILCERSGIINIAIEGMMLMGALVGALVGSVSHSMWVGLLGSIASAMLLAWVLAWLSIKYKINQIITGTVINIFSTGMTSFISAKFMQTNEALNMTPMFGRVPIPLLADIPFIGPILFNNNLFIYGTIIVCIVLQVALFSTRWGLRLRACGEHPKAADTLGINVFKTRYMGTLLGGAIAGFAGAYFTLGSVGRFDEMMTAGKGFIGLAAMIFGNWNPFGAFGAGMLFGFADAFGSKLSILGSVVPPEFMAMLPYVITMIVLAGLIGRGHAPASEGTPYEKE
ncbi:nucleoside ABC transporter membrane protein [Longilinea arvoryzae]|uniref:Nucleoside ABC transporter membrane protein n=1 Tax=Longilinea arvoryzae TaxID=360412 RepID=A0A0S7BEP2_9CHLR|nr:ABC transporter permease [Longilinea arvoryzae]GAP14029.1 nucleoside ABC transporter membrane protein [Longilinea arvoryzae]